jgi:hypothetical protein
MSEKKQIDLSADDSRIQVFSPTLCSKMSISTAWEEFPRQRPANWLPTKQATSPHCASTPVPSLEVDNSQKKK